MEMKRMRVLSPIVSKDGNKTYWARAGSAYPNKDGSINVYLDMLPTNGKLQLREWDEPDRRAGETQRFQGPGFDTSSVAQASADLPF